MYIIKKIQKYKNIYKKIKFQKMNDNEYIHEGNEETIESNIKNNENICTICLEQIINNNVKLKCSHEFHLHCLVSVILNTNKFNECPNCRTIFKVPNTAREIHKKDTKINELEYNINLCNSEIKHLEKILKKMKTNR